MADKSPSSREPRNPVPGLWLLLISATLAFFFGNLGIDLLATLSRRRWSTRTRPVAIVIRLAGRSLLRDWSILMAILWIWQHLRDAGYWSISVTCPVPMSVPDTLAAESGAGAC